MTPRKISLFVLALLLAACGCVPVAWLPDSSGFVCSLENQGNATFRLMHYDLAKKKMRVVVEKVPAATFWPAISPDGKQIAVAQLAGDGKHLQMRVIIYDLEGKETHRSSQFPWVKTRDGVNDLAATGVFWSAKTGKILVHDYLDISEKGAQGANCGIYDLGKKTMVIAKGRPAPFAGSPLRPDGKGFLVTKKGVGIALVDWDGKDQPIQLAEGIDALPDSAMLVTDPWTGTSFWMGQTAVVASGTTRLQIDTDKRTCTLAKIPKEKGTVDGNDIIQQFAFPGSDYQVRALEPAKDSGKPRRLELVKKGAEPKLLAQAIRDNDRFFLSPSPDGKWLAVRMSPPEKTHEGVLLISSTGEIREVMMKE